MTQIGSGRKLLLIGWDGADWGLLTPLLDRGVMPALDALIDRGTMARLSGLAPSLSPLLWTSIATGKRADKHGILSTTEPDRATGLRLPVSARGRRTSTLWEILDARGLRAHAIGWPASDPAGPSKTAGVVVSDRFARAPNPMGEPWPVEPGSVAPARLASTLGEFRVHPGELDAEAIRTFVPRLSEIDIARDHRPAAIADVVAEAATVHAAATWVLEHEPWDFLAVHYAAPERLCDDFLRYAAPPLPGVSARDAELYGGVVDAGYRLLDLMLARLVELAGGEATVVLVSDHGYAASPVRPDGLAAVRVHGGRGVFVAAGPGIRCDELIHGAGPLDVAPTVLALFDLPIGADMDGRPLLAAWQESPRIESIPTWDDRIARPEPDVANPFDPDGALAELRSQGYDGGPPPWLPLLVEEVRSNEAFHLAMVYLDTRRPMLAIPILKGLHDDAPGNSVVTLYLSYCLTLVGEHSGARTLLEKIGEGHEDRPLRWLVEAMILIGERKPDEAVDRLDRAGSTHRELPEIHTLIGHAYGRAGRPDDASRAYERALGIDDDWAEAHEGLARCHLRRHRWEDAADSALSAVGLDHHRPDAHYVLGVALARIGRRDDAARAFATALNLRPGWPAALDAIATLRDHHRRIPLARRI